MKVLVIDSHKGSSKPASNLHWQNAKTIADAVGGDLIWSYPGVNDCIVGGYDKIVFVHASHYAYTDYAWLTASPDAELLYVTNEYNLGEPRTLWMAAKAGRRYTVIANHPPEPSKVVLKYVKDWQQVNLNALCYQLQTPPFDAARRGCVYYGSFRKDRIPSFQKYLGAGEVTISTHAKNRAKFETVGVRGPFVPRLALDAGELTRYATSLYIEDVTTHIYYNHLANRFYEAISWDVLPVFDVSCRATVERSGYTGAVFVNGPQGIPAQGSVPVEWRSYAAQERVCALNQLKRHILGGV